MPLILGQEIVGRVAAVGQSAGRFAIGTRVGVPWLGWTCGACRYCRSGRENLCGAARFTGYTIDVGYADHTLADERFCFPIPEGDRDAEAAPLLCAGLIGYCLLRLAGKADRLGICGFGGAAHRIVQFARRRGQHIFAFVRPGDQATKQFAYERRAEWAETPRSRPPRSSTPRSCSRPQARSCRWAYERSHAAAWWSAVASA